MAEVLGAVASGITLAALFKTCLDTFDIFQAAKNADVDLRKLLVRLNIEKCRLYTWGEAMGLTAIAASEQKLSLESALFQSVARDVLEIIVQLLQDSEKIKSRYGCVELKGLTSQHQESLETDAIVDLAASFSEFSIPNESKLPFASNKMKLASRTRWAIRDKKSFTVLIEEVKNLVDGLQDITKPIFTVARQEGMIRYAIQQIRNVDTLEILSKVCQEDYPDISDAASVKIDVLTIATSRRLEIEAWVADIDEVSWGSDDEILPSQKGAKEIVQALPQSDLGVVGLTENLQHKLELMMNETREMMLNMEAYRRRADEAEKDRDSSRDLLRAIVEKIRLAKMSPGLVDEDID